MRFANKFKADDPFVERVHFEALFRTPAWKGQLSEYGATTELLSWLPNSNRDRFHVQHVVCLSILWCRGTDRDKANALLELINPPG